MGAPKVKIELPYEAQVIIRKCNVRGLILNRKGQAFEMKLGKIYRILSNGDIESHKDHTLEESKA